MLTMRRVRFRFDMDADRFGAIMPERLGRKEPCQLPRNKKAALRRLFGAKDLLAAGADGDPVLNRHDAIDFACNRLGF